MLFLKLQERIGVINNKSMVILKEEYSLKIEEIFLLKT